MRTYNERSYSDAKTKHLFEVGKGERGWIYSVCGSLSFPLAHDGYYTNTRGKRLCKRCDSYTQKYSLTTKNLKKTYSID